MLARSRGFFSAADRPILQILFAFWQFRQHAHDGGARNRGIATRMAPHHGTGHRDFGELEGDGAGVPQHAGTDLDQLECPSSPRGKQTANAPPMLPDPISALRSAILISLSLNALIQSARCGFSIHSIL